MNTPKPASIAFAELKSSIAKAINECGLQPFVVESVLREYLHEISELSHAQYRDDVIKYQKDIAASANSSLPDNKEKPDREKKPKAQE